MLKHTLIGITYKNFLRPVLFLQDAEKVHNRTLFTGGLLGSYKTTRTLTSLLLSYQNPMLKQNINGLIFNNPVGLAAGFDYDGHMAKIMQSIDFGFNTVGTVTAKAYIGNQPPRLSRLPKSKALFVNKGFKSEGVEKVDQRLKSKKIEDITLGISIGSSNLPEINTISKAIDDYITSFSLLKKRRLFEYIRSCGQKLF